MTPWRLLSVLLEYPEAEILECTAELAEATRQLPRSRAREAMLAHLDRREQITGPALQREYVDTFDFAKRSTLYLSFHAYGDRRQRGMAMLHLKQAYREAGFALNDGDLPDYLPAMLEFTDLSPVAGVGILQDFRPVIEVVRATLHDLDSPYAPLLDAITDLLPAITEAELADARKIAAVGPPEEQVGLEPFGPPEVMPEACGGGANRLGGELTAAAGMVSR